MTCKGSSVHSMTTPSASRHLGLPAFPCPRFWMRPIGLASCGWSPCPRVLRRNASAAMPGVPWQIAGGCTCLRTRLEIGSLGLVLAPPYFVYTSQVALRMEDSWVYHDGESTVLLLVSSVCWCCSDDQACYLPPHPSSSTTQSPLTLTLTFTCSVSIALAHWP